MLNTAIQPKLIAVNSVEDIPENIQGTPFETLLRFHNFNEEAEPYETPELLVLKCMDHRKRLNIPERFAYIIRNAGANMKTNEFSMAFAMSIGHIKHVALITHTECGMMNLEEKQDEFVKGMIDNVGWTKEHAEMFFQMKAMDFAHYDPNIFALYEEERFQSVYPNVMFQAFLFKVEDGNLYLIEPK